MPDLKKFGHIQMLSNLLSTMPPQNGQTRRIPFPKAKAQQWAAELVNVYGVRVHPELATETTLPDGVQLMPGALAADGAQPAPQMKLTDEVVMDAAGLLNVLRGFPNVPSLGVLADQIESALGDPEAEAAVLEDIRAKNPGIMNSARLIVKKAEEQAAAERAAADALIAQQGAQQ